MFAVGLALLIGGLIFAGSIGILCMYDFNFISERASFAVICILSATIAIIVGAIITINTNTLI